METRLHSRPRRFRWLLPLVAVAAVASATAASGSSTPAAATGARAEIDPALRAQLATRSHAPAVVTTWSRAGLAAVGRLGVRGTKLRRLPMLLAPALTRAQLERLARSPHVRSVYANERYELYMEDTGWITRARYVWSKDGGPVPGQGVTGDGVHIAVIDTGADGTHEDMENLVEYCETTAAVSGDHTGVLCSPFDARSGNAGPAGATNTARGDATDDNGHGTHVIGTIAGSGSASGGRAHPHSTTGLAPDAKIHAYSANIGASLASHQILASYDDMINKKLLGLSTVVAVSNSWGGGTGASYSPSDPIHVAVERAYDAGILSVFAAGNSGPEHNTLSRQCVSPWVVCVAATTKPDSVVMFSSRGRPSEPADTNRDGVVGGSGDVAPDNHDRALGQALSLGLYRPALGAPGVNINAMSANAAECRESGAVGDPASARSRGCYVPLNGTSMATPHVSGVVALVAQAFRDTHKGRLPTPAIVTQVLEASANGHKLPGAEAEEQGTGRLDAYAAVKLAQSYPKGQPPIVLGTATPPYADGAYPGAAGATVTTKGCTGTLSWTASSVSNPLLEPVGQPPVATERYGQHVIDVAEKTDRLRVTVSWPVHPSANLYVRLWQPGVDPDAERAPIGPTRVFPDQESIGLVYTSSSRWLDVKAPEPGPWTLRVYHRAGGEPLACDASSTERPKQTEGFNYTLKIERPRTQVAPVVAITSPADGSTVSDRWATIEGTASYPAQWDGVTSWEVGGSGNPALEPEEDNRLVLHFHGNVEDGCTGDGATDLVTCGGPFLKAESTLSAAPAASWKVANPLLNGTADRTIYDPSWTWYLSEPTSIGGPMTVVWWGACGACGRDIGFSADWRIRIWADGALKFEQRVTATPQTALVAEQLEVTLSVPRIDASQRIVLHVDPVYIDSQSNSAVYYDSASACPTAAGSTAACDSYVRMPVVSSDPAAGPAVPTSVRVTDLHNALRVAWASSNAEKYEIHRSTNPSFVPGPRSRIATTTGTACSSPDVPSWPSASRSGLCFTDTKVSAGTTYYYRVVGVNGRDRSLASLAAAATPTAYDRQVKVEVDRLFGPQYWEFATLGGAAATSWSHPWDTLGVAAGEHGVAARSFTQGVGSSASSIKLTLAR